MTVHSLELHIAELRSEVAFKKEGRAARTLMRAPDLRVVLVALKEGAPIAQHRIDASAVVQVVSGVVRLHWASGSATLERGECAMLVAGLEHDAVAVVDSALLLTFPWGAGR
ncbi:MAG: hypothetical protein KC766_24265 [Myxococcales bacterium]|nr:hypothetical protein [Myxococcales bacterium]